VPFEIFRDDYNTRESPDVENWARAKFVPDYRQSSKCVWDEIKRRLCLIEPSVCVTHTRARTRNVQKRVTARELTLGSCEATFRLSDNDRREYSRVILARSHETR